MFSGLSTGTRRVALVQAALTPVAALLGWVFAGKDAAVALPYGVLAALAVSLVLVWREWQAMRHPEWDAHRLLKQFIRTGVERLVVLVVVLLTGLGLLKLAPLPLLLGVLLAQLAWLASMGGRK